MSRRLYYRIVIITTAAAAVLDILTGQPFLSGPICLLYIGFSIGFQVAYWAAWASAHRAQLQQTQGNRQQPR
jgi:hypothetical protein